MFFTVHSSASGAFPFPVDQKKNDIEMCTCGRPSCHTLPPSALLVSCPAEKGSLEQRTCPHRIKSRMLNTIQGRDCKAKPRSDRPFFLTIEAPAMATAETASAPGGAEVRQTVEIQVLVPDESRVAAFRLACKTDTAQHTCSKRSCEKKKSVLKQESSHTIHRCMLVI